ncbi:SDR family oxidoreductase [Paenibacillus ginsengarvi]|uniref:SDR family NAD(P)-dependent oxidoreductase n=1 Tax=Paenibacillus ginsengarvi TaxID=400777 RepID=A0A3B0CLS3_9BACL|nr:SDR family oxidoreductase [Paenibacillus ginsengarvi]RKN85474.1 SDR family NAD(P)-dependent oxidoreductase [Paenibacillus ginsengarvi]
MTPNRPLAGKVAVVAGATRGAGRGIATMLGEAGATVYVTGRSTRGNPQTEGRPETIEETADMVNARGGIGIAVRTDHTVEADVKALFERVDREQNGRLDILVNDVWGGDALSQWNTPFWEHSLDNGLLMQQRAVHSHIITSHYGVPLMVRRGEGLVIEITDGSDYRYRGTLYYSLAKISAIHLAEAMAADLKPHGVTALSLTPGFLRSEAMLDIFGVTESNWRDGVEQDEHFAQSETPSYIGKAVAALAGDPNVREKSGKSFMSGDLAEEYGFFDTDGSRPNWNTYYKKTFQQPPEL